LVILLAGASGFIGRHLAEALLAAGHSVVAALRHPRGIARRGYVEVEADFSRSLHPEDWLPRLVGVDIVINAVGIIREAPGQSFELLHERAPQALFCACREAGVKLVLQISALGADAQAHSAYHRSKKAADDYLRGLDLPAVIIQPSLVYGPDGASARLFGTLAALPLLALPRGGVQQVQPLHIDDLCAAVLHLVAAPVAQSVTLAAVGPQPLSLAEFLAQLRAAMGLPRAPLLALPLGFARIAAHAGAMLPGSLLDDETLAMLERGNVADATDFCRVLGHAPRAPRDFIGRDEAKTLRLTAQLGWLLPLLRWSIALVWIVTGIVSLGLYPLERSYALLAAAGVPAAAAPLMLVGAALLDLAFGIFSIALPARRRRPLWIAQLALILFYTAVISIRLPEFWLHPYGPLLKNLPLLAAIWLLSELERQ
jgi:uncharacterized protein YbjT (DUF2867 family)